MADCCEDKACAVDALRERQSSTLKTVLGINAVMFAVELAAGLIAGSTSALRVLRDAISELRRAPGAPARPIQYLVRPSHSMNSKANSHSQEGGRY